VVLYRHFDSKTDLYQAVLDRMCGRLDAHVAEPVGGFTDASIDGLLAAAAESPAGFRLLFQHALREPEFKERIEKFRADTCWQRARAVEPGRALRISCLQPRARHTGACFTGAPVRGCRLTPEDEGVVGECQGEGREAYQVP
jgi:AcrR family transcriptional regulator